MASGGGSSEVEVEEEEKKRMFRGAMEGDWDAVVNCFEACPKARGEKLTKSGDTALHLAVTDGQVEIVKKLVDLIFTGAVSGDVSEASEIDNGDVISSDAKSGALEILNAKNERGNTPLHLAAAAGQVKMCHYLIGDNYHKLIDSRNEESETPLFLPALHGKKEAFHYLHFKCPESGYSNCRKKDGETVLHCAITGEYFDLAFLIIHQYKELIYFNNEKGLTPLHLLAAMPSAFKSGSHLRLYDRIIYHCIFVDQLRKDSGAYQAKSGRGNGHKCPENYRTCLNLSEIVKVLVIEATKQPVTFLKRASSCFRTLTKVPVDGIKDKGTQDAENPSVANHTSRDAQGSGRSSKHEIFPPNYYTLFGFFKGVMKALLVILGIGFTRIRKIVEKKEKHTWAMQIMDELVNSASGWDYYYSGRDPNKPLSHKDEKDEETTLPDVNEKPMHGSSESSDSTTNENSLDKKEEERNMEVLEKVFPKFFSKDVRSVLEKYFRKQKGEGKVETPILIAARMGIVELVKKILDHYPVAVQDLNTHGKNIVLLAVENRQPYVYNFLLEKKMLTESAFRKVDNEGNSALHLAATLGEYRPWLIPGAALQMQWEIKWYKFVKESKPPHFFVRYNKQGRTPKEVFTESHKELVTEGGQWLINTSQSCSVVAALIATVSFATASTVPGGVRDTGTPALHGRPAFDVFAISSLVALCFSVTAVIVFLSILTSRYQEKDFRSDLPKKLILGLSSLFLSIASMLVSFCAGHFFVLKDDLKFAAFPVYAVTCLPATYFAAVQFPLYFDLIKCTIKKVPQRSYKIIRR